MGHLEDSAILALAEAFGLGLELVLQVVSNGLFVCHLIVLLPPCGPSSFPLKDNKSRMPFISDLIKYVSIRRFFVRISVWHRARDTHEDGVCRVLEP